MTSPATKFDDRSLFLSLSADAALVPTGNGELVIQTARGRTTLKRLLPGVHEALERLGAGGANQEELERIVFQRDGMGGLAPFYYQLQQLGRRNLLWRSAEDERGRLATLTPASSYFTYPGRSVNRAQSYALSRFAFMRVEEGRTLLESPLAHARLVLHDWRAAALLQTLALPARVAEAAGSIPGLSVDAAAKVMTLLLNAAILGEADDSGMPIPDGSPALQSWEFHDLLFHTRSREGRHDLPIGGTCRFAGKLELPPPLKLAAFCEFIELNKPNLDSLQREDPPFAEVIERRCSLRQYGEKPITSEQLGEFLFRVARVKQFREMELETPTGQMRMATGSRPYPAGGGLYEMEFYLAINACDGLTAGLYHYDPKQHRLGRLAGRTTELAQLLGGASGATGVPAQNLQVLVILTARFQRLAWKYAAIAYALILKHVGVVYQTMYLTATAMRLAPCAVGCGNADLFAHTAGTDYYSETSVGEFLLGSRQHTSTEVKAKIKTEG